MKYIKIGLPYGEERIHYSANVGSEEAPIFELDDNGEVVITGKTNVYKQIQTFKDQVLLSNIVERLKLTGETLVAAPENFGDASILPKDLLDAHQKSQQVNSFVGSLSDQDLALLNEKGFDGFLQEKLNQLNKVPEQPAKEGDKNE